MKNYFLIFVFAIFAASCLAQQSTNKRTTSKDSIEQQRLINLTRGSTFKSFDAIIRDRHDASDLNFENLRVDLGLPKDGGGHTPVYFAAGNLIMEYGSNGDTPPLDNTGDGKVGHIADHAKGEYLALNKIYNYAVSYADTERDLFGWGDITGRKTSQGSEVLNYYPSATPPDCICGDMKYDIARSALGGSWRLPSYNEIVWLKENCTWTWKDAGQYAQDAPAGYLVIGCSDVSKTYDGADHSGSSIFLPTSGSRLGSSVGQRGNNGGSYWSGTISKKASTAYCLRFYSGAKDIRDSERYIGFAVRPVAE